MLQKWSNEKSDKKEKSETSDHHHGRIMTLTVLLVSWLKYLSSSLVYTVVEQRSPLVQSWHKNTVFLLVPPVFCAADTHLRWCMCVWPHVETLQHPLRAHSFMLGLGFNVWLGCWHITHMCSGRCQLVCLATVKTGGVSAGPTCIVSLSLTQQREWLSWHTLPRCTSYCNDTHCIWI